MSKTTFFWYKKRLGIDPNFKEKYDRYKEEAIATRSQQQIKWLFDHFGGDSDCLMAQAVLRSPEELGDIYD